jgi:hypothetical protein
MKLTDIERDGIEKRIDSYLFSPNKSIIFYSKNNILLLTYNIFYDK